jgi:adenosylhomocysteine nucleosidase
MPKVAIVAALEREVGGLIKNWSRISREHEGREFIFFEHDDLVAVCGGIGVDAARRTAEAVIALYHPTMVQSVGFAGALDSSLHVGDVFTPSVITDARDGSRMQSAGMQLASGEGSLVTFMAVAGAEQKLKLARAYAARAVDMEAAGVAASARAHAIPFAAIKVISDEMDFEIPGADRFIDSNGQFRTRSFVLFAALRPWLWMRVATLARNSNKAAKSLAAHLERSSRPPVSGGRPRSDPARSDQERADQARADQARADQARADPRRSTTSSGPGSIQPVAAANGSPGEGRE